MVLAPLSFDAAEDCPDRVLLPLPLTKEPVPSPGHLEVHVIPATNHRTSGEAPDLEYEAPDGSHRLTGHIPRSDPEFGRRPAPRGV